MLIILDSVSCIITQHIQGRLYFDIYLNIILLFGFSNELGTWDVQIVIIVLFKSFVTWYNIRNK